MSDIGNQDRQNTEQHANNGAENFHRPFRRREQAVTLAHRFKRQFP